jgi:hypothetical protein
VDDIIKKDEDEIVLMWALDYGVPLSTRKPKHLIPTPSQFQLKDDAITCIGLHVSFETINLKFVNNSLLFSGSSC